MQSLEDYAKENPNKSRLSEMEHPELKGMVDEAVLEYLDLNEKNPSRTIESIDVTLEKEKKEREKEFKKNFDLVKLESSSWTIDVPVRKNKAIVK